MPRPPRATPCRLHHITSRGNNRGPMYEDAADRDQFYAILARAIGQSPVLCHLDVLMGNHYHLLLEGAIEDVSALMWQVNYRYALAFNGRHERVNHLVGSRFHATPVADARGARAVALYVALNPVRHGFCEHPQDWPYGAFLAYAGLEAPRAHLTMDFVRGIFLPDSLSNACDAAVRAKRSGRPDLAALMPAERDVTRDHLRQAVKIFGYAPDEIADFYGVSRRTLNRRAAG